jgi:hypothetical protein
VCDVPLEAGRVNQGLVVDGWECRGGQWGGRSIERMVWGRFLGKCWFVARREMLAGAIDRENGLGQISWQVLVCGS